ncbi:MAG: flavin reductase family protein [Halieaceae bacterium]|jgi:flavin reductase (DIM6/NTAB) family NADH-FMN oxidoreductase RutF|uniref:flavin reductase family protein n=1 Tax=Haliea alexandrii TaxID=2448162 RepID=UPI000F0BD3F2|nr:flavin reductase family protein [Haliea alexandrii]MCR9186561.1 flavin reductase family protein [Halieaceae bacterium]
MHFTAHDIGAMGSRYRAAFINSLSGFKPANLVGTADAAGNSNLAIISSVVHLGSHPPLLALIVRPSPVERHTLENILDTRCYTINHVQQNFIEAAHQTAARYPREQSEFTATGLGEHWVTGFAAPFVREATVRMGLELREHHHLQINDTHLVIGEVVLVDVPDEALGEDGAVDINAADSVALSGLDSYYTTSRVRRMAYAKPDLPPRPID